jgi:hypothetical protein
MKIDDLLKKYSAAVSPPAPEKIGKKSEKPTSKKVKES